MLKGWLIEEQVPNGQILGFRVKRKLASAQSSFQKIDIVDTYSHGRAMALDNKIMLTEKDEFFYHEMLAHVALNSCKSPHDILIIGGGDGGTARECLKHPEVSHVDVCEIDPLVIELSKKYLPFVAKSFADKRVQIHVADGCVFLRERAKITQEPYDAILVDSTDPEGPAAKLFGRRFYQLVKQVLLEHGILCTQCESPLFYADIIPKVRTRLCALFQLVKNFTAPVPTYPSGYWSFVLASNSECEGNEGRIRNIAKQCTYYNEEIHRACFALPNFFKDLLRRRRRT